MTQGRRRVLYVGITCGLSAPFVAGQLDLCMKQSHKFIPVLLGFNPVSTARLVQIEGRFHETTTINVIKHRCIKIRCLVMRTCRHRRMDIGAILADDKMSNFTFGRQKNFLAFLVKSTVQCTDGLNHKVS